MSGRFDFAYRELLTKILTQGDNISPRKRQTRELLGQHINLDSCQETLLLSPERALNYRFAIAEALWIISGSNLLEPIACVNQNYRHYSDDGVTLAGAYGPRLKSQLEYIVSLLTDDPNSRQAVATIWTPNPAPSLDIPCTISVQFLIRDGRLHSIWNMRSSDAWIGLPYDVFSFGLYSNYLACELGVLPGSMQLNFGSSHLYQEHIAAASELIQNELRIMYIPKYNTCSKVLKEASQKSTSKECLNHLFNMLAG
jgi:thymidylate synthase